jgi:hypothetical protein
MVYYIKAATNISDEGKELMGHVYQCCLEGNPDDKHIFTSGSAAYIQTDIKFLPLTPSIMGDLDITARIKKMKCGTLELSFLSLAFYSSLCFSLIRFKDESLKEIHTILSFKFNNPSHCIEVRTFCCDDVGGGTIFNFLINAVNCGIDNCDPDSGYERKIILSSLPEAKSFYRKYGFKQIPTTPLDDSILQKSFDKQPHISGIIPIKHPEITEEITEEIVEGSLSREDEIHTTPIIGKRDRNGDIIIDRNGGTIKKTKNKKQKKYTTKYKKRKSRKSKNKFTRKS